MKKYLAILCAGWMALLSVAVFADEPVLAASSAPTLSDANKPHEEEAVELSQNSKIIPIERHEQNQDLHYTIDISYPQVTGPQLSKQEMDFNQQMSALVNQQIQQFIYYVKSDIPHFKTLPEELQKNSMSMDYDIDVVPFKNDRVISVRLATEMMQGGRPHPYHKHISFNFDVTQGKVLVLKNLFKPHARYLVAFSKYSASQLDAKLSDKFMIADGTKPVDKNYEIWNLDNDGFLITFDEYQVAPYVYGAQEVRVPFDVVQKLMV